MRLGRLFRLHRALNDLTLRALAAEIGIGYATLCRIENGCAMDSETLLKIMTWLMSSPSGQIKIGKKAS